MRLDSGLSLQQEVGWDRATVRAARLLAAAQDQPFLVTSPDLLVHQLARWQDNFPLVRPSASASAHQQTLEALHLLGVPITFTNKPELAKLSELGGHLATALFANSCKLGSQLKAAKAKGVGSVFCDSVEELEKIKKFHPNAKILIELSNGPSADCFSSGSGATAEEALLILAESRRLELNVVGIALGFVNIGQEEELPAVVESLAKARALVEEAEAEGHILSELHLGRLCIGGTVPSLTYTSGVHAALACVADMALQADASHWLVAPTVTLAAKVIGTRTPRDQSLPIQYYINDGVFGAFSGVLAGEAVAAPMPLGGGRNRRGLTCRLLEAEILGPSGDELDVVAEEVLLPQLQEGDWLLFPCIGAASLQDFGEVQAIEGSREGGLRLKKAREITEGVLPIELAWAQNTIMRNISVSLAGEEDKRKKGEEEGACADAGKELEELELGKTFIWEDC